MALGAAGEIVEAEGRAGLTARKVAGAIGYTPGTLYNLFRNLDEMILHLNGHTMDQLGAELERGVMTGDAIADVETLLCAYLGFLEAHRGLWDLLFEFSRSGDGAPPDWYRVKVDRLLARLEAALAPLFGAGRMAERAQAARVLWASLHGICSLAASGKLSVVSENTAGEMARSLTRHYLAGLGAADLK